MPKKIKKSLHKYLSKIKISDKQIRYFRRPQMGSFTAADTNAKGTPPQQSHDTATLSDIDQFLFENFRSLYREEDDSESEDEKEERIARRGLKPKPAPLMYDAPLRFDGSPPKNLSPSPRFFVASGSSSSRIVGEASSSSKEGGDPATEEEDSDGPAAPDDFIALLTFSPEPYEDFRRSMQEMVDKRVEHNGKVDWSFLEELLFCFLDMNNKKSYRHILRAFVDLIVVMRQNSGRAPPVIRPPSGGGAWRNKINN